MGSSVTPFLPSGGGGQIGAFPTFPGAPLFADEDGLVTVGAFPPLAAFGFGTFCPTEDQQQRQQQQLIVPGEQQHQFLHVQSQFLGETPLFTADEPQLMICAGSFPNTCELQRHQNYFTTALSASDGTFVPMSQDLSIFGSTNCAIAPIDLQNSPPIQSAAEVLAKSEKSDENCKASPAVPPPLSAFARRGHPTPRGSMRRRVAERIGKRKVGQNAKGQNANANLLATITAQPAVSVSNCDEDAKYEVKNLEQQQQLYDQQQQFTTMTIGDPLTMNDSVQPITTVPSEYSMPNTVIAPGELKWCAHCKHEIRDCTMLAIGTEKPEFYHCECLKCSDCAAPLDNTPRWPKCYVREERIYCIECYGNNFVKIYCATCDRRIDPFVWVRRAREFFYHLACFKCEHCKRQLGTGDQYSLDDLTRPPPAIPRLLCQMHYTELVLGEQSSSKQKTKRVRTTFGEDQLNILQQYFKSDSNPDGADLERIAHLTGLSKRVTQVWFQNSRARQKKYHGHASCRKSAAAGGGAAPGSSSASVGSGNGMDTPYLGGCRSATMTPSSSSNGARTAGQSPTLFVFLALIWKRIARPAILFINRTFSQFYAAGKARGANRTDSANFSPAQLRLQQLAAAESFLRRSQSAERPIA
ncbi:hypothetical protein niasHS_002140 [Heterodera schachtii]|uniref:Uncharacterized protein n=1 Tax=Heterodera schachtii TaxID=97005 RepID=A0ABD2KMN0_HETSC